MFVHVCRKTAIFDSKPPFLPICLPKTADFENGHRHMGELFVRGSTKTGSRWILVARGKLTCHRIDKLFKPNCPPDSPPDPLIPPRRPPRRFEKKCNLKKKRIHPTGRCNLLAVSRGRFAPAGDGSPWLIGCLETLIKNDYYGAIMTSTCAIYGVGST